VNERHSSSPLLRGGLIVVTLALLCAVAILPLLRTRIPCSHDGSLHYFRVVEMKHMVREGLLFSRWLPDLAFGYGFPFFNYRAPFSYYLVLGLHLTGLALPLAMNLAYVLGLLGCALGAFLLARDHFGTAGGAVAGIAYAYAPYTLLDIAPRANLPESIALALFPFILWAFRRLVRQGERRWLVIATGLLALLYVDHNISSLLFTPFLVVYAGLLGWFHRRGNGWKWAVVAIALALGISAFFWLPALAEKGYVQIKLSHSARNNDFHYNFIGLAEILAPPAPVDTALLNPPMEVNLGLVQVTLATLGIILGWVVWRKPPSDEVHSFSWRERRASLLLFAAFAALLTFMSTSASLWLWENVPLLPFVQFPWRLIGRAALPVALLAGAFPAAVETWLERGRVGGGEKFYPARRTMSVLTPFLVAGLVLAALPATTPPLGYCSKPAEATIEDIHSFERKTGMVSLTPLGVYFPIWVQQRPEGSPLEFDYTISGRSVARFDESALPEGAMILEVEYDPNRAWLIVESPTSFRARYLSFYFPGWRVTIDGNPVAVAPSDPEGLITFDVPAGRHTIAVCFGETPLRRAADIVSLVCLLLLLAFGFLPLARRRSGSGSAVPEEG